MHITQTLYIYFTNDVRICGYFSKKKGVREQNYGKRWSDILLNEPIITDWKKFPNITSFVTQQQNDIS